MDKNGDCEYCYCDCCREQAETYTRRMLSFAENVGAEEKKLIAKEKKLIAKEKKLEEKKKKLDAKKKILKHRKEELVEDQLALCLTRHNSELFKHNFQVFDLKKSKLSTPLPNLPNACLRKQPSL